MDIRELNLSPREQRTLESMGFSTVEKIALCYRDDLGFGKSKGEAIIQRARNLLAYHSIKDIADTEGRIIVTLSDASRAIVASVEDALGVAWSELRSEREDNRLIIFRPERKPCFNCGGEAAYLCTVCGANLCERCRYDHEHGYYKITEIRRLEEMFSRVREKAQAYTPMSLEKRMETEAKPSEEVAAIARERGFEGFVDSFFSELEGNELMKKALSCALFSTPEEPVHALVVGRSATGASIILGETPR